MSSAHISKHATMLMPQRLPRASVRRRFIIYLHRASNGQGQQPSEAILRRSSGNTGCAGRWTTCSLMWTDARRRWNGRGLTGTMPKSFVGWIGSSSNHRRGVFRKSVRTQRLPSIPTWHAKNSWILIMRGGAIRQRSLPITHHKKRAEDGCKHLDRRVMAWYAKGHRCPRLTTWGIAIGSITLYDPSS